ncbi:SOS response-associated peptidase family protein [Achromobacter xylosoxidans]|uniref:SOS response-associated peptidase family protein n=1 Tax=Alcaligenes xylosoxydans xylosoxydans TaxID=85698 RepID=UPI002FCDFE08
MIDVHDRRPVALPADLAIHWMDPEFPTAQALALLEHGLPETAFTWHPVRQEVSNSKYEMPDAIEPAQYPPRALLPSDIAFGDSPGHVGACTQIQLLFVTRKRRSRTKYSNLLEYVNFRMDLYQVLRKNAATSTSAAE